MREAVPPIVRSAAGPVWPTTFINIVPTYSSNIIDTWTVHVTDVTAGTTTITDTWNTWIGNGTTNTVPVQFSMPNQEQLELWERWGRTEREVQAARTARQQAEEERNRLREEQRERQRAHQARERERYEREREQRQREFAEAGDRAFRLLRSMLSDAQRTQMDEHGMFRVVGSLGGMYDIRRGVQGNIYGVNPDGSYATSFCAHAPTDYPVGDQMLAQKLLIETNEREFLEIANRSGWMDYAASPLGGGTSDRVAA